MDITFIHLYNNYSGSPKVLELVIKEYVENGHNVELIVNKSNGFLSGIENIKYNYINYKWSENKLKTLLYFISAQIQLFFKIIFLKNKKQKTLYVNTILPFGAVIAGKLCNMKIIYHVHERYINPNLINRICELIHEKSRVKSIFVSEYLKKAYPQIKAPAIVIYNKLDCKFQEIAIENKSLKNIERNEILLVASLRRYKGIYEFIDLCGYLPELKFNLILSGSESEIESFKLKFNTVRNLFIYSNQQNLHPFYQNARVLLNLSKPTEWIETFGLTILEAMTYGIPTIVPTVGGPTELIKNNYNGFLINSTEVEEITKIIKRLYTNKEEYERLSRNAYNTSLNFNNRSLYSEIQTFINTIEN